MLQPRHGKPHLENKNSAFGSSLTSHSEDSNESLMDDVYSKDVDSVSKILRGIPGNDKCAECSASEPDWASLNLGILLCIECSGVHRNFGVHISKVHSFRHKCKPFILLLFYNVYFLNWIEICFLCLSVTLKHPLFEIVKILLLDFVVLG